MGSTHHARVERHDDILANHGIHVAGTNFDQSVNLAAIMPELGYGSLGPGGRRVPGKVYFDLSAWHLINTVYAHHRVIELREMISMYANLTRYQRLMTAVTKRLGHHLAALAEQAAALDHKVTRIVQTAEETLQQANRRAEQVNALYFTGGSTGLGFLTDRIAGLFPHAKQVAGDRFSSVASGLEIYAVRRLSR